MPTTHISSPLRLALFVCYHLLQEGYGRLRFYSFCDSGLRICFYSEMEERGRNGEALGLSPFWYGRYSFNNKGVAETCFDNYVARGLTIAEAAAEFRTRYADALEAARAKPSQEIVQWFEELIDCLPEDAFPITLPHPSHPTKDEACSYVNYKTDRNTYIFRIPLSEGDFKTVFPFEEYKHWKREEYSRHEHARHESNYAEWKRRTAQISPNKI